MSDSSAPKLRRLALGVALVVAALIQVQAMAQTVHSQSRRRERVAREERQLILAAAPRVGRALESEDPAVRREALREIVALSGISEIEIHELTGQPVFAYPGPAPVAHWPDARELDRLRGGDAVTVGPIGGEAGRLFSYLLIRSRDQTRTLRLARQAPELMGSLSSGQRSLMLHGAALVVLVLALPLALGGARPAPGAPSRALEAYEEAMGRLQARGQEAERQFLADRQALENQLEDQEAFARAGELTAGIVHEVRNGLATILGHARLLDNEPAARESAETIRQECEALEVVIGRFMEFVKRERLHLAPFSLGRLLGRVVARESRSRSGAPVVVEAESAGERAELIGDEELLERAFENLVRNAREAAGARGQVRVTLDSHEGRHVVRVSDDGPGLAPELRHGVRPFVTTKPGGLGLGLALALKIVRLHGGALDLAQRVPHGAVVTVTLSALPPDSGVTERTETGPPASGS